MHYVSDIIGAWIQEKNYNAFVCAEIIQCRKRRLNAHTTSMELYKIAVKWPAVCDGSVCLPLREALYERENVLFCRNGLRRACLGGKERGGEARQGAQTSGRLASLTNLI